MGDSAALDGARAARVGRAFSVVAARSCPGCGQPAADAGAVFCGACGRRLGAACAGCGRADHAPDARHCTGCGLPLPASVSHSAAPPRRTARAGLVLLGLGLLAAAAWGALRHDGLSSARVVVVGLPTGWRLSVEDEAGRVEQAAPDGSLPAGPCVVRLEPPVGEGTPETIAFTVQPGAVQALVVRPGRTALALVRDAVRYALPTLSGTGPLGVCTPCRLLVAGERCARCGAAPGAPVRRGEELVVEATAGLGELDRGLIVANPTADLTEWVVRAGDEERRFALEPEAARALPAPVGARVSLRVEGEEEAPAWERTLELVADLTLVLPGEGALCAWRAGDERGELAPPVTTVALPRGGRYELPEGAGGPLLVAHDAGGSRRELVVLAARPLRPPPRPLGALVVAPGLNVTDRTPPGAGRITAFASDGGALALVREGRLVDARGAAILTAGPELWDLAAGPRGWWVLTTDARLAALDGDALRVLGPLGDPTARLVVSADGRLHAWGEALGGLVLLEGEPRRLAEGEVTAAAPARRGDLLLARGARVDRVNSSGATAPVVLLASGAAVIGVAEALGGVAIATAEGVSLVRGDVLVPVVIGAGGPLASAEGDGLLLLDVGSGRLLEVSGALGGAQ